MRTSYDLAAFGLSVIFAAPVSAACTAAGVHDGKALKYICEGARAWADSVASGDSSAVERVLADDFLGVDPKGRQYRKDVMVLNTRDAPKYFKSNRINDVHVRFFGSVAVAQGSESWERQTGERGRFVWTDTWLKRNGKWQIIAAQDVITSIESAK